MTGPETSSGRLLSYSTSVVSNVTHMREQGAVHGEHSSYKQTGSLLEQIFCGSVRQDLRHDDGHWRQRPYVTQIQGFCRFSLKHPPVKKACCRSRRLDQRSPIILRRRVHQLLHTVDCSLAIVIAKAVIITRPSLTSMTALGWPSSTRLDVLCDLRGLAHQASR